MTQTRISLDDRLFLPPGTAAILWDLDGTLVDSFQFDLDVCARILSAHAGLSIDVSERLLREGFALSGADFWRFLFKSLDLEAPAQALEAVHADWLDQRLEQAFPVNEGVREALADLIDSDPEMTVVGRAADAEEAIRIAGEVKPDVVLVDVKMPAGGGPLFETTTIPVYIRRIAFEMNDIGHAAGVAMVMLVMVAFLTNIYFWVYRRAERRLA